MVAFNRDFNESRQSKLQQEDQIRLQEEQLSRNLQDLLEKLQRGQIDDAFRETVRLMNEQFDIMDRQVQEEQRRAFEEVQRRELQQSNVALSSPTPNLV